METLRPLCFRRLDQQPYDASGQGQGHQERREGDDPRHGPGGEPIAEEVVREPQILDRRHGRDDHGHYDGEDDGHQDTGVAGRQAR